MEKPLTIRYKKSSDIAICSTEAYYSMPDAIFSMSDFTAELLEARSEADIERICDKFQFKHPSVSPCADPRIYRKNLKNTWIFKSSDDFVPSYASWLFEHIKTISACLKLYAVCLPIARGISKNSVTTDLFSVLFYAQKAYNQMVSEVYHNYDWIPHGDIRERRIKFVMREVPEFPLMDHFESFQKEEGCKLQEKYGYTFKQMRRRGDQSPLRSQYYYWENPTAHQEVRDKLWSYTTRHRTDEDQYILLWDAKTLSLRCLEELDKHIEENLRNVSVQINSVSGTARLITKDIESALNLWLFTQIQAQTNYRVCKMCGKLFIPRSQKGKKYCDMHKKHEINYYNKTVRQLEEVTLFSERESPFEICV